MRALVDDTKQLSLNNNNNHSRKNSTLSSTSSTKPITPAKPAQNNNKIANMQKQKQPSSVANIKTSSNTGAVKKQQKPTTSKIQDTNKTPAGQSTKQQTKPKQQDQQQKIPKSSTSKPKNNNTNDSSTTIALPKASHANTNEELAGGAQDTIYLCNFRVSVDGDWLCLKELQELDVGQKQKDQIPHNPGPQKNKRYSGFSAYGNDDNGILALENFIIRRLCDDPRYAYDTQEQHLLTSTTMNARRHALENGFINVFGGGECTNMPRDTAEIERSNLVNICKLVVKELLEQSLRYGRMLDSDHLPLQHFFIVIEHVLGHGLRPKKGILGPRKELWDLLQSVEQYCPEAQDITTSVRDLPTVRTHIGRARAWLRIALMQKKLADYLQALIEHREDALYEYYEPFALMMSDEIIIVMGILVGLNVIDCNLCVKEEDLDSQQGVIDFSLYLRSSSRAGDLNDDSCNQIIDETGQGNMIAVLDQKNYIEELNRHLNATVANLQAKVESLTTTNALMKEDLAIARNSLLSLQAENQALRQNTSGPTSTHSLHSQHSDNSSSSTPEKISIESLTSELAEQKKKNVELDKELKLQITLKAETDVAMKLLEKDNHEKQDTIVSLRRQLDDIKQINLEMYRKLQECEDELTQKGEMVSRLQTKASQIGNLLMSLEKKYENNLNDQPQHQGPYQSMTGSVTDKSPMSRRQQNLEKFEALTKKHKQDIGPPLKRLHLKMDAIPPFNPNNYRKSPSGASATFSLSNTAASSTFSSNKQQQNNDFSSDDPLGVKSPTSIKSFTVEETEERNNFKKKVDSSKSDYALAQEKTSIDLE